MKEATNRSTYTIRTLRMYDPKAFPAFVKLCRDNCTSATSVINSIINEAVKSGKLPNGEEKINV